VIHKISFNIYKAQNWKIKWSRLKYKVYITLKTKKDLKVIVYIEIKMDDF